MASKDNIDTDTINQVTGRKFSEMSGGEKLVHLGKVVVFVVTFGFLYPTIFSD